MKARPRGGENGILGENPRTSRKSGEWCLYLKAHKLAFQDFECKLNRKLMEGWRTWPTKLKDRRMEE